MYNVLFKITIRLSYSYFKYVISIKPAAMQSIQFNCL